ncbi:MAG: NigD-like protein [Prevotella sp.]
MKTIKTLTLATLSLIAGLVFTACSDDDYYYIPAGLGQPNALVTVKPATESSPFYLQLDDSTRMTPLNLNASPYGDKEVRAFINFHLMEEQTDKRNLRVHVNWIDSILTKKSAPDLGEENVIKYGKDPVNISPNDWVVIAEDGYLTLRFSTTWSRNIPHLVNLVTGTNPDDPYEVTFYHNNNGDRNGMWGYGIVAFKLDKLPDTEGKTVDLTLKWNSYEGEKSARLKYCTRKASGADGAALATASYVKSIK